MAFKNADFIDLYDKYVDSIYRFIYFRVNDEESAWDLTQDCFLKALEYMNTQKVDNPRAFMYQVARNIVIDFWRKQDKQKTVYLSDIKHDIEEKEKGPDSEERNDIALIIRALDDLPGHHRDLIIFRYVDGLSFAEISQILGKSQVSLRVQASRIVKQLKIRFDK